MPRHIDRILDQAAIPDTATDDELEDLKQEIVRNVTATLMFGARPAPQGHDPTRLEYAEPAWRRCPVSSCAARRRRSTWPASPATSSAFCTSAAC
ncbi:hypothetical protein [Streptomyces sp. NPDC046727]|uniref:hypothetical protein n=1 Tax=Streptomyces sp. NPDC046727 TaxID=3155373 RepID=UPI0033FE76D8